MAQQADSEAITLMIQKLTEIVEKQNLPAKHSKVRAADPGSPHQVAAGGSTSGDHEPSYLEHGSEILLAEDSIAVVEEVVGGASPLASDTMSSPAKSDQGVDHLADAEPGKSHRQVLISSDVKDPDSEQVILNFPVKVGNLNITSTEGLIATLQKLDSALQHGSDPKVIGSEGQGQPQGQGQPKDLFRCAKCDYCSHNKHYLKQHMELTHNADRPFKCPFCNYAGKRSHSLKEHLIVHSNCRPYSCMYCNATFRKKGHLTNHVKMHVNHDGVSKPLEGKAEESREESTITYQCSSCSFATTSLQGLTAHLQTHDPLASLMCETCDLQFADAHSLTLHINSKHVRKDPAALVPPPQKEVILVCSECGYKTQDKTLLTEHMVNHIDNNADEDAGEQVPLDSEEQNQTETETEPTAEIKGERQLPRGADAPDATYRCAQCSFTTRTAVTFIQHMLSHKPQKQTTEASPPAAEASSSKAKAVGHQSPAQKQKSSAAEPAQPFTHDKSGGVYRCSICGYTCELQRTIKSHIWKHSGHHDIDYPMFRNGPISVYDDYPIGVPYLMSEKAPVMQMACGAVKVSQPSPLWMQTDAKTTKDKAKEMMLLRLQARKAKAGSMPGKEGTAGRNRNKTISQILAESQQSTGGATEQGATETEPGQAEETDAVAGHMVGPTGLKHEPETVRPPSTLPLRPSPVTLNLPAPAQYPAQMPKLSPSSPDGGTTQRKVLLTVPGKVYKAGTPTFGAKSSAQEEKTKAKASSPVDVGQAMAEGPGQQMPMLSTLNVPTNVSLPGSEILKLILKKRLQPAPSGPTPPVTAESDAPVEIEQSPSVTAEAGSSAGDASDHDTMQEQATDVPDVPTPSRLAVVTTTPVKRKVESLDELELYRLAKKLRVRSQDVPINRNVVVEEVSQAYTTPRISLLDSRGASPRSYAYSPRSISPRSAIDDLPPRARRGRSRSAEEVRKPPSQIEDHQRETQEQQPTVTLLSLLKKGPNLNPACPMVPKPTTATKDDRDGDKRSKQGISSSLLAVIEQLRERSRSESDPDDSLAGSSQKTKHTSRKRSKRGSADDEEDRDALLQNYANIEQVGEQYRCKLCHYTNAHAALLKVHMRQHKVKKPFECSLCEFLAKSNEELQDHMLKHCKVRTYQCKLCATSFSYKSQLRAHMRIHAEQNPYLCDHCDFQGSFSELKQHMLKHDRVYYICNACESTFESEEEHRRHEAECKERAGSETPPRQHRGKRLLQCSQCDFLTNSQAALLNHAATHKGFEVQCELCNFTATSMRSLKSHMKRHVNDQKFVRQPLEQYKCNLCGYVCHHLPSLKSHMWRHASDTNYSYQDSNDIINAAIDLDTSGQGQAESEEKVKEEEVSHGHNSFIRFRCCQCGFESVDRSELNDHMTTHKDIIQKTLEVNRGRIMTEGKRKNVTSNSSEDSDTEEEINMEIA